MSGASRPLVLTPEESGGANLSASDAVGSRGAHSTAADARGGLHMRNSRSPRRSSSGYFSNDSDSLPSSPLFQRPHTADEATQTVSPSAQVIEHAVRSLAAARGESAHQVQHGRSSALPANSMGDTPAVEVGRVLREQGDAYNRLLTRRARAAGHPQWRPADPREPAVIVCVGLLIFLFGRLLYSHGTT